MTIAESLFQYIGAFFEEIHKKPKYLGVDWLDKKPGSYSVDVVPSERAIKAYTDGSSIREYPFVLSGRFPYSQNQIQNLANLGFFEDFSEWLSKNSREGNLPLMESGKSPHKIEAVSAGYLMSGENNSLARYQIQCKLTYRQKGVD